MAILRFTVYLMLGLPIAACGGDLGYRSVAEFAGRIPLPAGIRAVRIELDNGTLGCRPSQDPADDGQLVYAGGVRRAADSPAALAVLEAVPLELQVVPESGGDVLLVRGPQLPAGAGGLLAVELGIRLPAAVALEVSVAGNGHVTLADRAAPATVRTGRGDLRFERCAGGVEARTGRGTVIAFGHRGDLDVQTMAGDMQAFVKEPGRKIRLVTGQGTVQCHVPGTTGFDLDARAEIGKIGSGFGAAATRVGDYGASLVDRRGDGATRIVLRTASGHLSIAPHVFE